ncbi:uncharacterized protein A1O9_08096, partial [Exophiala aquamarina CBS 119918]
SRSGEEPPSGLQGQGTVSDPYDRGNAPENVSASEEPPAGVQGKGTVNEPFDQGNAPENPSSSAPNADTSPKPAGITIEPPSESKTSIVNGEKQKSTEERGRDALRAPAKNRIEERDVSPGTLPDGSHAKTSGERGEGYEPGRLNKLKSKFPFGKH